MEQHAIPQQISSYEFKLVGEMTLKQFLKAAAGIVIALLINATPLIFFIKWPLMLIIGGGGLALAFVPFEDRPLDEWLISFIKSIYSPTIYTYKKTPDPNWLQIKRGKEEPKEEEIKVVEIKMKDKSKVAEFIKSLPSVKREEGVEVDEEKVEKEKGVDLEQVVAGMEEIETETNKEELAVKKEGETLPAEEERVGLNLKREKLEATGQAVFGEIPMPDKPEVANVVVGMVTDNQGKIVEEAIVEIQDERGNPSRVLKTNPLGQFRTTTQLANGRYLVIPEKEGYKFDRVEIVLTGQIVDPIKIKATL